MKGVTIFIILVAIVLQSRVFADGTEIHCWGPLTNDIQMTISLDKGTNEISLGEPVELLIQFRDSSTNEFKSVHSATWGGLTFIVTDPFNRDVSPVWPKDEIVGHSVILFTTPPGQIRSFHFDLSALYKDDSFRKLDKSGTYEIIAMQKGHLGITNAPFSLTSNPLRIRIRVPDKGSQ